MKLKSEKVTGDFSKRVKVNKDKKNILQQTWKAFTKNTSIHALHYLTEESIKLLEKILWFFILFFAFMTMIYCCILLSNRFQSSLTSTVFESTYYKVSEIPFAGVTLCNNNRLDYNKTDAAVEKFFSGRKDEEVQAFVKLLHILQNMDYGSFDEFEELSNYSWKSLDKLNLTETYDYMIHDCETFLVKCIWRRKPFDCCKYFSRQKSEYGICWSFNSFSNEGSRYVNRTHNFPWRVFNSGRHSALHVTMHVHPELIVERKNNQHGILAIVHHPHEHPNSAQFIAAKSITSLIIKPTSFSTSDDVKRLSPIDRQCYYEHEALQLKLTNFHNMPYLRANCMSACRQEHLILYCNCTVGFLFPTDDYPECNVTGLMCLIKYNEIFNAEKPLIKNPFFDENEQGIVCNCLPDCSRVEYGLTVSPVLDESPISEKYVAIDIHYGSSTMIKFRTDVAFAWLDLIVGFGGILGLFFGCSLLSGAEIFYFSTIALIYQRKRNNEEVSTVFKPKYPFIN